MTKELTSLHNWLRRTKEKWHRQVVLQDPTVPCPLTREQMQKLVDVGVGRSVDAGPINFFDQAIETEWNERFAELVRFKNENGHTDVSEYKHKDTHFKLGVWVRSLYRYVNGGTMRRERERETTHCRFCCLTL
jgi:Helicase associated domain